MENALNTYTYTRNCVFVLSIFQLYCRRTSFANYASMYVYKPASIEEGMPLYYLYAPFRTNPSICIFINKYIGVLIRDNRHRPIVTFLEAH